ncbi:coagulation factor XI-like [Chaetodon trifascialis]|uniref:coagulation factor XI-like n=1 Tax=Chaetodon trifascialis TaxID=109706 RepID=UPI003992322A
MKTHVVFVGLLSFCGLCSSKECSSGFLENVVLLGTEKEFLYSPDTEHCQQLCTHHPACRFFTFRRPDSSDENRHFHCHMKTSSSGLPEDQTSLQGVTSGLSLKSCNTDFMPCLPQVYPGVDFSGADYQTLFTADYDECQRTCTNDPSCQFFTFLNGNFTPGEYRYKCHLKFSWTVPRTKIKKLAGLVSGFSQKIHTSQQSDKACQTKLFANTVIPGNNMENLHAASPEHCQALCSAHPKCTYFSYISRDFKCYLKNNPNEMVVKAEDGATSGLPTRSCQPDNSWIKTTHADIDFWGSDYHDVLADDADACQRTCTEDPNCQFYSYVTDGSSELVHIQRICYLKRVITAPAPPNVAKLANVVSGFSLKNCRLSAPPPTTPTLEEVVTPLT